MVLRNRFEFLHGVTSLEGFITFPFNKNSFLNVVSKVAKCKLIVVINQDLVLLESAIGLPGSSISTYWIRAI